MLSVCPACHKQVEHEDHLFEVVCACGTRFNPFLTLSDSHTENTPTINLETTNGGAGSHESLAAFQELVDFGNQTAEDKEATPASSGQPVTTGTDTTPKPRASSPQAAPYTIPPPLPVEGSDMIITPSDHIDCHGITQYFAPISVVSSLSLPSRNPLQEAFARLSEGARSLGANAIVGVRWQVLPDGTKILMAGYPVQCQKQNA